MILGSYWLVVALTLLSLMSAMFLCIGLDISLSFHIVCLFVGRIDWMKGTREGEGGMDGGGGGGGAGEGGGNTFCVETCRL